MPRPLHPRQCAEGPSRKLDEAAVCLADDALELNPDYVAATYNLGVALKEQGKLDEAVACYRRAWN